MLRYVHFGASSALLEGRAGQPTQHDIACLPPLLFDLVGENGAELTNLASSPLYAQTTLKYAQKMLSFRMRNADRTLTHLRVTDGGLYQKATLGPARRVTIPFLEARL